MPSRLWARDRGCPGLIILLKWSSWVFLLFNAFFPLNAFAEGVNLFSEYSFTSSSLETKNKATGEVTEAHFSTFLQRYNLNMSKRIYPFLTFSGGGILELDRSTVTAQDVETTSKERLTRPLVELHLANPVYSARIGYRKTEIKDEATGIPTARDFREGFSALLRWKPVDLPEFGLNFTRNHFFDTPRTLDSIAKLLTLNARYRFDDRYEFLKGLGFNYNFSRTDAEDRLNNAESLRQVHNGRADYSRGFLNRRLNMDTGFRIGHSAAELSRRVMVAGFDVTSPLLRSSGRSSLDDTPEDGPALGPNTALIDGNLEASSGIDIGLAGDETTLTNIGLDFGFPVSVDTIFLWVDRRLSSTVSGSFTWLIYTSPDNTGESTWTLHATVSPAPFGMFQNRFEIAFSAVETQFIKVVTSPLSTAVPGASNFPNIFVTEMEAFTTLLGREREVIRVSRSETLNLDYNLSLRGRLSDKATTGYNFSYRMQERDPSSEKRSGLFNSANVSYRFNKMFTGRARLSRDDSMLADEESTAYNYSASLRAAYLETFQQTLTYSGTQATEEDVSGRTDSIFLRNFARLYRGWDAYLDVGHSWGRPLGGGRRASTILRLRTNLVPNEKITINMNYSAVSTKAIGEDEGPSRFRQTWNGQAFYSPFRNLSLFARLTVEDREDFTRLFQNYSVNWSPFPEGALQFFFIYTEQLGSEGERRDTIIGPGLRWKIRRGASFELLYHIFDSDSTKETTDSRSFSANLRVSF